MKTSTKTKIINSVGYLVAAGTPVAITASQFPIWVQKSGEAQLSGSFLLACCIGAIPLIALLWRKRKELKRYMSFAPLIICLMLWGMISALEPIIKQLKFILMVTSAGEGVALALFSTSVWITKRKELKDNEALRIITDTLKEKIE